MSDAPPNDPEAKASRQALILKLAVAFLAPLFFVVAFPLLFVGAIHKPTPNDLSLLIVGPAQVVSDITTVLDETAEYTAIQTDIPGAGQTAVEDRAVMGAIDIAPAADGSTFTVTTYYATAEGQSVAAAVRAAGDQIAAQLGTTATGVEVAPLGEEDPLGTNLFYLMTYTSLAAYLVIIVLMQVQPGAKLRYRYTAVAIAAVGAPLLVFGLSSIFVGDYGASFGSIAALLGVNTLYVFTAGAFAVLIEQVLGKSAAIGIMAFIVLLNFPSSGGPTPAALLPTFWQGLHGVYFGSGAYEAFRSIIYFDGHGAERWVLQLLAWAAGLVLVTVIVQLASVVRRQKREIIGLTSPGKHLKVETYIVHEAPDPGTRTDTNARSITAGEGIAR